MTFEDQYLDVLQNIEFAIISVYREQPGFAGLGRPAGHRGIARSATVQRLAARPRTPVTLPETEAQLFARVQEFCELRLGRGGLGMAPERLPAQDKTVEEIVACLRRIRKSVERWNKRGGQQGYVTFVSQFIK